MSELQAWVDKLGDMNPGEIRTLMQQEGIRGLRGISRSCPLAKFLKVKVGESVWIGGRITCRGSFLEMPDSMRLFASNFDFGNYPELELREMWQAS